MFLVECFLDPENGVCAKFGLSLIRDNWDFYCLKDVGYDRGYVIQTGKNLHTDAAFDISVLIPDMTSFNASVHFEQGLSDPKADIIRHITFSG